MRKLYNTYKISGVRKIDNNYLQKKMKNKKYDFFMNNKIWKETLNEASTTSFSFSQVNCFSSIDYQPSILYIQRTLLDRAARPNLDQKSKILNKFFSTLRKVFKIFQCRLNHITRPIPMITALI